MWCRVNRRLASVVMLCAQDMCCSTPTGVSVASIAFKTLFVKLVH